MLVKRKIWLGLTVIASSGLAATALAGAQGSEAGEGGEGGDFPGGTFERALALMMAGEGGEGGIGLIKGKRSFSVPALDDAQVKKVVSGNTLRTEHHVAYYFDPAGSAEGWEIQYEKVAPAKCAPEKLQNGECWTSKTLKLPSSKWTASDGKLCLTPAVSAVTGSGNCAEVYLALNKVALYGTDGKLVGKGSDLHKGRKLEEKTGH